MAEYQEMPCAPQRTYEPFSGSAERGGSDFDARFEGQVRATPWIAELQLHHAGRWVALTQGQVVGAADSAPQLVQDLEQRGIRDTTLLRVPETREPELVGMG